MKLVMLYTNHHPAMNCKELSQSPKLQATRFAVQLLENITLPLHDPRQIGYHVVYLQPSDSGL